MVSARPPQSGALAGERCPIQLGGSSMMNAPTWRPDGQCQRIQSRIRDARVTRGKIRKTRTWMGRPKDIKRHSRRAGDFRQQRRSIGASSRRTSGSATVDRLEHQLRLTRRYLQFRDTQWPVRGRGDRHELRTASPRGPDEHGTACAAILLLDHRRRRNPRKPGSGPVRGTWQHARRPLISSRSLPAGASKPRRGTT
jgi:hypothetical protein